MPSRLMTVLALSMLAAVSAGYAIVTPNSFFQNPLYWTGLLVFSIAGGLGYGSTKSLRLHNYSVVGIASLLIVIALVSTWVPQILTFAYGFVGIFIGLGLRVLYEGSCRNR